MKTNKEEKKELAKKFSKAELLIKNHIDGLFTNPEFIKDVRELRVKYKIPKDGYSEKELWPKGKWNKKIDFDLYGFSDDIEKFQLKYELPLIWIREMKSFILHNIMPINNELWQTMIRVVDLKERINQLESKDATTRDMAIRSLRTLVRDLPIVIMVHPSISETSLRDYITRNYETRIKRGQVKYKKVTNILGKYRSKNTRTKIINSRIMELKKENKTGKEIAEIINSEFSLSKDYTDINTIIRNEKKLIL